jgi:hypothetical protein
LEQHFWDAHNSEPGIPIVLDSDSDAECGYMGGVNCDCPDDDFEPETGSSSWSGSDGESLVEYEGEELEKNLQELQEEVEALAVPTMYAQIMASKTRKEWTKAEKNRALRYTGNLVHRQQAKKACENAAFHEEAQTS